jgi:hypothetical protein
VGLKNIIKDKISVLINTVKILRGKLKNSTFFSASHYVNALISRMGAMPTAGYANANANA